MWSRIQLELGLVAALEKFLKVSGGEEASGGEQLVFGGEKMVQEGGLDDEA